jgi:pyruvate formate lyase activating enzyme
MGRQVSIKDLYAEVALDRPFWERSGGGVTLSGGEPLVQLPFVKAFLKKLRQSYVHTAIESCLHVAPETLEDLLPFVNTMICDMKLMDDDKHKQYTGVSNNLIQKNMARLLRTDRDVRVRMPLIPCINDDEANLSALGRFLQSHREGVQLEILPYHRLGESKYTRLNRSFKMVNILPPTPSDMKKALEVLGQFKLDLVKTA